MGDARASESERLSIARRPCALTMHLLLFCALRLRLGVSIIRHRLVEHRLAHRSVYCKESAVHLLSRAAA